MNKFFTLNWLGRGLYGESFKATLQLYLAALAIFVPMVAVIADIADDRAAIAAIPLLVGLAGIAGFISVFRPLRSIPVAPVAVRQLTPSVSLAASFLLASMVAVLLSLGELLGTSVTLSLGLRETIHLFGVRGLLAEIGGGSALAVVILEVALRGIVRRRSRRSKQIQKRP